MKTIAKDLRKRSNGKLKGFTVCQGCAYFDKHLYVAFERGNGKSNHAIKIAKYTWPGLKCVKVSKPLQLGHANDMTAKGGVLYITHSGGRSNRVLHRVDAKTLKKKSDIKIKVPSKYGKTGGFSGVTICGTGYLLRLLTTKKILKLDKNFKVIGAFSVDKHWKIANGMCCDGKTLIRTYSQKQKKDKQRIAYFNLKGHCTITKKIPVAAEMEGCFAYDGKLYLMFYTKKKVKNKTKKECMIVQV